MTKHKITFYSHLKHLFPYLLLVLGMYLLILYVLVLQPKVYWVIYIPIVLLVINSILNIYLHFEYYLVNRGVTISHDEESNHLVHERNGIEKTILPTDVIGIEIYQSRAYRAKYGLFTTDNYKFYKIILEKNDELIITSLLYPKFEYMLDGKTKIINKVVASTSLYSN
jgi:hypothetical protein